MGIVEPDAMLAGRVGTPESWKIIIILGLNQFIDIEHHF